MESSVSKCIAPVGGGEFKTGCRDSPQFYENRNYHNSGIINLKGGETYVSRNWKISAR